MTTIVVSQPMFFPWVGLFEQIRLADVYVHYDDVQFPQGRSFMNRVQIKTADGSHWLTAPVERGLKPINEVRFAADARWRDKHLATLRHAYAKAPNVDEMLDLARRSYELKTDYLGEFNRDAIERIASYFGLQPRFVLSSELGIAGSASQRLLDIVKLFGGTRYVTGHGARNYLDHEMFERDGIEVAYMDYQRLPYRQLHGEFTPYVSILDLTANEGREGAKMIRSEAIPWREFVVR